MANRAPRTPVAWLFGRQLISSLKGTLLYFAFGEKLDARDWMRAEPIDLSSLAEGDELWFDYISDCGDGQTAMYAIAYLALSDVFSRSDAARPGDEVAFGAGHSTPFRLRRGRFLLVGGDTAYHVADARTLRERFQRPFQWAADDLGALGRAPDRRLIFGIPGNHDYYDAIDGFNRVFRRPFNAEDPDLNLSVAGFERTQEASYFALRLPFDWWLFGLDAQGGAIDKRQAAFFRNLVASDHPDHLVLATPEPSTVFGRRASPDSSLAATLDDIGLARPFLEAEPTLPSGQCRLDLSGDVHHYARYWGGEGAEATDGSPPRSQYASVVAGLGGAFLHSSETDFGEVTPRRRYPSPETARDATMERIVNPWYIANGGGVWLIGGIAAGLVYFGAGVPDSGRWLFGTSGLAPHDGLFGWLRENVFPIAAGISPPAIVQSLIFLVALVAAGCLVMLASHIRDTMNSDPKRPMGWLRAGLVACWIGIVVLPYLALWGFGRHGAAVLVTDIALILPMLLYLLGLPAMGWLVGGARHALAGRAVLAGLGLAMGIAQLLVPYLLPIRLHWAPFVVTPLLMAGSSVALYLGRRAGWRWPLALIFVGEALLLVIPPMFFDATVATEWGLLIAVVLGAVTSCVLFGQYLLVATSLHAHNNEAGGAARIERFKQIVRLRLRREGGAGRLTAYVIAIDDPKMPGDEMQARIVDCFEIAPSE